MNAHGSEEGVTVISCDGLKRFSDGRRESSFGSLGFRSQRRFDFGPPLFDGI